MNDCKHQGQFSHEHHSSMDTGEYYLIRCDDCQTAIGLVPKNPEDDMQSIKNKLNDIQSKLSRLK